MERAEPVRVEIGPAARLVVHTDPGGAAAARFRLLRVQLRGLSHKASLRSILITSATPQEGKSTVALNLATALAEGGSRSVLLIDADLHRSNIERVLGLKARPGLAECLGRSQNPDQFVTRLDPLGWHLLPHGEAPGNPSELLQTAPFAGLLQDLLRRFEWILVDSPPVLPLADAVSLSRHTDASLVVARAGQTPRAAVEETVSLLGERCVLGVLLNGAESIGKGYSKYYRYYKRPPTPQEAL